MHIMREIGKLCISRDKCFVFGFLLAKIDGQLRSDVNSCFAAMLKLSLTCNLKALQRFKERVD